MTFQTHKKL